MKTVRKLSVSIASCILLCASALQAQSNDRIDELLSQNPARLDSVSYMLLSANGLIPETETLQAAFDTSSSLGFLEESAQPETAVRIDRLSFMLMKSLGLQGGIMYRLFPGPRYAYKHLVYLGIVSESGGPFRLVAGDEVIRSLGYALELKGGSR